MNLILVTTISYANNDYVFRMSSKINPQKNTLLKNAQANCESNFFKRVFFSPTQEKLKNKKKSNASKK